MPVTRELDPTAGPLHFFGAEVRRWRTAAGQSQEQLGQLIGYSAALVGRVELGERSPSLDFAAGCDRALPAAGGLFGRLYQLARNWEGGYPSWFAEWVEAERRATTLRTWQLVSARIERQAIFQRDDPPALWAVLDEGVLRRRIGSAPTMRGQLLYLLEVSERSTTTMQVVPAEALPRGVSRDLIRKVAEEQWTT